MIHAKRIGVLICVIAICFTFIVAPSGHAQGLLSGQQFGAWISAALASINIIGQSLLPAPGPVDPYFQWLSSPASTTQEYEYPVGRSVIQDYLNASTIVVHQGVTTIDGVDYDEVFVEPGTFTRGLKTNLFDFKTKWNILSGQSGITLAEGAGFLDGVPIYKVGNNYISANYKMVVGHSFQIGNSTFIPYQNYGSFWKYNVTPTGRTMTQINFGDSPWTWTLSPATKAGFLYGKSSSGSSQWSTSVGAIFVNEPFHFGYTSGVVPADQSEIPDNYGLSIQIPHDQLQTFYNTYPQYNVDNSVINIQEDQIDIDELTQAIFDQIQSMEDIKAEWNEGPVEPEPEPEPPAPVEDVIEGLNVITQQQFEQMQQQQQLHQQQQQTQQQQLQEQQQISQNTSEINDTIKDVTATPDAEHLPDFKFDLRELFPFCIPFDIYRLLSAFDAEPVSPHVQIPFVIESLNFRYDIDLDFYVFDPVAAVLRTVEFIVYALGLAWATGKVIKW